MIGAIGAEDSIVRMDGLTQVIQEFGLVIMIGTAIRTELGNVH